MNNFYVKKQIRRFFDKISGNTSTVFYDQENQKQVFNFIKNVKKESGMLLETHEAYNLLNVVKMCSNLDGDVAEVGVYTGGSAKIIADYLYWMGSTCKVHLFDTFQGIPKVDNIDSNIFRKSLFTSDYYKVKSYLECYPNIEIYPGLFPKTGKCVKDKKISFVHIDVDTYQSTFDSLEFFYHKMVNNGIMLIHDYSTVPGVKNSVDDFCRLYNKSVLELAGSQGLIHY